VVRSAGLICLPFAGGSSLVYRGWRAASMGFELCEAELPGRGRRADEPLLYSMDALVDDLLASVAPQLQGAPYVLFGHSFGGLLAFALADRLQRLGLALPHAVFVSGVNPPHHPRPVQLHRLNDVSLVERFAAVGGVPAGVAQQPGMQRRLIPALRADLCALETHSWPAQTTVDIPIEVIGASGDPLVECTTLHKWGNYTTRGATVHRIEANTHFYLDSHRHELLALIASRCVHHARTSSSRSLCIE
jgi:medium-chain acyl-[acyl-carrier-protein] hydrolase